MKKILMLFVASAAFLVSCSSNDDSNDNTTTSLLYGKWEAKSYDYTLTVDGEIVEDEDGEFEIDGVIGTIFEFSANNVVKITTFDEIDENEGEWVTDEGTYVYNEAAKLITITTVDDFDGSLDIIELKVRTLTNSNFNFTISETIDLEEDEEDEEEFSEIVITMDVNCERKN